MNEASFFHTYLYPTLTTGYFILWTIAYGLVIYRGFKDKALGFPVIAIIGDATWEFYYTFCHRFDQGLWVNIGNGFWFLGDVAMLVLVCLYWKRHSSRTLFVLPRWTPLLGVALFAPLVILFSNQYDSTGTVFAFMLNVLVSVTYIPMLLERSQPEGTYDLAGTDIWIAITKGIGTLFAAIVAFFAFPNETHPLAFRFTEACYVVIFLFDVVAIYLHLHMEKTNREHPWT